MSLSGAEVLISEGVSRADGKVVEGMGAEEEMGEEIGNEGRDEGSEREVGMNGGGTGNEEGRVGYGLGDDKKGVARGEQGKTREKEQVLAG